MARTQKPLTITHTIRVRTPQEKQEDYAKFARSLTPAQRLAMIAKLEQELAEERKLAAKQQKGGQAK